MNQFKNIRQFEQDTLATAKKAQEEGKEKKYEHLMNKIRNLQKALLNVSIREENFQVENLPDDVLGKVESGKASIDEVVFNDYETLVHTLAHEQMHLEGIEDDAVIELIVQQRHGTDPIYKEKIEKLMPVIHAVGKDFVLKLYVDKKYSELFDRYKSASRRSGTPEEDIKKTFLAAFPELHIKK